LTEAIECFGRLAVLLRERHRGAPGDAGPAPSLLDGEKS